MFIIIPYYKHLVLWGMLYKTIYVVSILILINPIIKSSSSYKTKNSYIFLINL